LIDWIDLKKQNFILSFGGVEKEREKKKEKRKGKKREN